MPYIHPDYIDILLWYIFAKKRKKKNDDEIHKKEFRQIYFDIELTAHVGIEDQSINSPIVPIKPNFNAPDEYWHFEMFNKRIPNNILEKLKDEVNKYVLSKGISNLEDLPYDKTTIDDLRKIYKDNVKMNSSSTILVHHPNENNIPNCIYCYRICDTDCCKMHRSFYKCCKYSEEKKCVISILTGDAEFDDEMLKRVTDKLQDEKISIFQIPHHGSRDNWKLLKKDKYRFDIYIIPFGYGNTYHHPNYKIYEELLNNKKCVRNVTQIEQFSYFAKM